MRRNLPACLLLLALAWALVLGATVAEGRGRPGRDRALDRALQAALREAGFTGRAGEILERRLGRAIDRRLAEVGRMLWFDPITGLNDDNSCAGCHSPAAGFGDTQSIAIGIENNGVVGPGRTGPRNMRRSPMVINSALFPNLMWNSRFAARSGDPFDNSAGFEFPPPEGDSLSYHGHLLIAQALIPPTERTEVTGFAFEGDNDAIRAEVARRLNATPAYRRLFGRAFPEVRRGAPITVDMFAQAIAEFEFSLTFADAPLDRYARGQLDAMSAELKRGALLFFGKARCAQCHSVAGASNEMFSDFAAHVIGVPQVAPSLTNNSFDGPGANEDFGREQVTGDPADRYAFRTSPLRNVAVQPTFMHNGAYTTLEAAIVHHLDPAAAARAYTPAAQGLDPDLAGPTGPVEPVLARLDPILAEPVALSERELHELVAFVRDGLLDPRARPERLRRLVPRTLPSGREPLVFEFP